MPAYDREHAARDVQRAYHKLNAMSSVWQQFTPYPRYFETRTVEFLLMLSRLRRVYSGALPRHVLEVGCGIGYSLALWSDHADYVCGIDLLEAIEPARKLFSHLKVDPPRADLLVGQGEDLSALAGKTFDLVVTQYVLEHVDNISAALAQIKPLLAPDGLVLHVLNNQVDRAVWYIDYRQRSLMRRVYRLLRTGELLKWLSSPDGFTPPHEPKFGDFGVELHEYSLEGWAAHIYRAGYIVIDYFQSRDNNWVYVTAPRVDELGESST